MTRNCKRCNAEFTTGAGRRVFCSDACGRTWHRRQPAPVATATESGFVLTRKCVRAYCKNTQDFATGLCLRHQEMHDERFPVPGEREPLRRLYEAKCLMCSRGQSYQWSDDELNAQHGTRFCGHCGGRVLIDRADIGNPGSPMLGHTTGYKSLAVMGRKAG